MSSNSSVLSWSHFSSDDLRASLIYVFSAVFVLQVFIDIPAGYLLGEIFIFIFVWVAIVTALIGEYNLLVDGDVACGVAEKLFVYVETAELFCNFIFELQRHKTRICVCWLHFSWPLSFCLLNRLRLNDKLFLRMVRRTTLTSFTVMVLHHPQRWPNHMPIFRINRHLCFEVGVGVIVHKALSTLTLTRRTVVPRIRATWSHGAVIRVQFADVVWPSRRIIKVWHKSFILRLTF